MTSEEYAQGYRAGYQDAYAIALSAVLEIGEDLTREIEKTPKLCSGYSIYDGGWEDGRQATIQLIKTYFLDPNQETQ